jgi:translation initiation factor 3 subunit M
LSNIFNALPRNSALRLPVYRTLIATAVAADQLDTLQITVPDVEKWLSEWSLSSEQTEELLKQIIDAFLAADDQYVEQLTLVTCVLT